MYKYHAWMSFSLYVVLLNFLTHKERKRKHKRNEEDDEIETGKGVRVKERMNGNYVPQHIITMFISKWERNEWHEFLRRNQHLRYFDFCISQSKFLPSIASWFVYNLIGPVVFYSFIPFYSLLIVIRGVVDSLYCLFIVLHC